MLEGDWQLALFKSSNGLRVSLEISNQPSASTRIAGNSAANDEGRALAARWRDKNCHGGIPYQVSHLLISAVEVVSLITSGYTYREGVVTPTDPKGKEGEILLSRALGGL
jgi:hypothetical protein